MGFFRSSASEQCAKSDRTAARAERVEQRDPFRAIQIGVKAIRQYEKAERRAGRR